MTAISHFFLGGVGTLITLDAVYTPTSQVTAPTDAIAQFQLTSAGDIRMTTANNTVVDVGDFLLPVLNVAGYEARMVQNSGTSLGGAALNTFLALSTTRTWTLTQTATGGLSANSTLTVREIANPSNSKTATIIWSADAS
jgi:hypothetical protein